ncbi:PREDICTED: uncharacterized protein LOC104710670 [Camelina sativa]|uniref:Uncharacterized protein LOC104710670 n=1 Tax=Camelina sativa TaxID=90675 RepID=A0ABM1QGA2_CAMSA|nr:PREDICTED: uncharacterized protein LOC104710670 [Camelina sativa]
MRPPINIGGRSYGQSSSSQAAGFQRTLPPRILNPPAAIVEPVEQMEENLPVQRDVRVLDPARRNGAIWFKNNTEVSTRVRKIIEGNFKGAWYSWGKVLQYYRDAWFSTFKTRFRWDPTIEHLVKANFDALAATRLKGMVSLAKSKGKQPEWILSEPLGKYGRLLEDSKSQRKKAKKLVLHDYLVVMV